MSSLILGPACQVANLGQGNIQRFKRGIEDDDDEDGSSSEGEEDGGSIEEEEDDLQYRDQLDEGEDGDGSAGSDDDDQVEAEIELALIDAISLTGSIYADELYDNANERREDDSGNAVLGNAQQNEFDDDVSLDLDFDMELHALQNSSSSSSEDDRSTKDDDDDDDLIYDSN